MSFKKKSAKGDKKTAKLAMSDFTEGQLVTATVKKVEAFGMFLVIEDSDVSGLCHKSEVSVFALVLWLSSFDNNSSYGRSEC